MNRSSIKEKLLSGNARRALFVLYASSGRESGLDSAQFREASRELEEAGLVVRERVQCDSVETVRLTDAGARLAMGDTTDWRKVADVVTVVCLVASAVALAVIAVADIIALCQ